MYVTVNTVITAASLLTAAGALLGVVLKVHKWYLRLENMGRQIEALRAHHEDDVGHIKEENRLVCYALSACLDGLRQLGANHTVPDAKNKLDKYLNEQAHH